MLQNTPVSPNRERARRASAPDPAPAPSSDASLHSTAIEHSNAQGVLSCMRTCSPLDNPLRIRSDDSQHGTVVALLFVRGKFDVTMRGGGGGRDRPCHGGYRSDHGIGQIFTVLDSFSSSVSSISGPPTQHLVLIAIPIYCKRASSASTLASSERQHCQRIGDPSRL